MMSGGTGGVMSVRLVWMLDVDPERIDEARALVAERREQVRRHSCRDLTVHIVIEGDLAGRRAVAIEEFDTRADLEAFKASQPHDDEAQATIARTFAPVGPFTVVDMVTVEDL
jgi:hypothetical protein